MSGAKLRWLALGLAACAGVAAAFALKAPCREPSRWNGRHEYASYCYNEFTALYSARGFDRGQRPYLDAPLEYPVLSGALALLANTSNHDHSAVVFFDRLAALIALAAFLSLFAVAALIGPTRRAFAYALAPPLALYLFQNFDQWAVAFALIGLVALRRGRTGWAGVAFGAGAAAKIFPGVVALGAAVVLLAEGRRRAAARLCGATVASFLALNLPFAILNPSVWWQTYSFHAGRLIDWGSILYWLGLRAGWSPALVTRAADVACPLLFIALLGALYRAARRRPVPVETGAAFALAAFLLTNKVWSPQYALWLLPFLLILELPLGWFALFSFIEIGELAGKFQWFAAPGGIGVANGWTQLFEMMVWARFFFTAALAWRLVARPPAYAAPVEKTAAPPPPAPLAPPLATRHARKLGAIVFAIATVVYAVHLDRPRGATGPGYVHDECYQAFTAHRYALGDRDAWSPRASREAAAAFARDDLTPQTTYEWIHPPGAKLIMAGFIRAFGFNPFAWRLGSLLFGLLTLFVTWRLAARLRDEWFAALALTLLATDGLVFVMSRIAMNDIYATACVVAAMYAMYRFWIERKLRFLIGAGALFGVGLAMKWTALPLYGECALIAAARLVADGRRDPRGRARAAAAWTLAFAVAPPLLYLAAYIPYFLQGHGLADLWELVRQVRWYHSHLAATHTYGSRWYSWPLLLRPVCFFYRGDGAALYAMGNPILFWAFLPALGWLAARFARARNAGDGLILVGFFGAWLPWMLVGRVGFLQYLLPAVPFGALAVAAALDDWTRRPNRLARAAAFGYLALCLLAFLNFHSLWSGAPVGPSELAGHRLFWFDGWR